jgi:Tol biopolymer transport system component
MAATRLTNSPEHFRFPGWCSSGGKIAYANTGGTTVQPYDHQHDGIYVMNADGSKPTRIVQIDFSRELANNGQSIIGAFSGGKTLVGVSGAPSFSPDCKMLTYSVNLSGRDQIYIVNADGTRLRQLTNTPGSNLCPSFSH